MTLRHTRHIVPFLLLVFLTSCTKIQVTQVEREKLFGLSYGYLDDELAFYDLDSNNAGPDSQIFMRDGMFYISNSESGKVLQFTSFGDLLAVYYNPEISTVSSFPASKEGGSTQVATTRKAITYPFNHPTYLAVDFHKRLFVLDQLPDSRQEYDSDAQVLLRDVILRFNSEGQFIDYIGQEGAGGTPFSPVTGIYVNSKDELIVVAMQQSSIHVFWYTSEGALLFHVPISFSDLPSPYDTGVKAISTLEKVVPDLNLKKIYLKIDYFIEVTDTETQSNAGIRFERSSVYPFNLETEKYEEMLDIPAFEDSDEDSQQTDSVKKPYEFIGTTANGWLFFSTPAGSGYEFELLDSKSHRILRCNLSVDSDESVYNALMLSSDGILSALLASRTEASVVWWRTDKLIGEIRK